MNRAGKVRYDLELNSSDFVDNTGKSTRAVKQLRDELNKLEKTTKKTSSSMGKTTLSARKGGSQQQVVEGMKQATEAAETTEKGKNILQRTTSGRIQALRSITHAISSVKGQVDDFSKHTMDAAGNAAESLDAVGNAWDKQGAKAQKWVKENAQNLQLSKTQLGQNLADLGQLADATGYDVNSAETSKMLTDMIKRAVDIASRKNIKDVGSVIQRMTAATFGKQTKAGRSMGSNLEVNVLEDYAQKQGIKGKYKDLKSEEQIRLRIKKIMEDTASMDGDLAKTQNSINNRLKTTQAMWENVLENMGETSNNQMSHLLDTVSSLIGEGASFGNTVSGWILPLRAALGVMQAMSVTMEFIAALKTLSGVGLMGGLGLFAGAGLVTAVAARGMMGSGESSSDSSTGVGSTPGSEFSGASTALKGVGSTTANYEIKIGNRQLGKAIADTTSKTNVKARNYQ